MCNKQQIEVGQFERNQTWKLIHDDGGIWFEQIIEVSEYSVHLAKGLAVPFKWFLNDYTLYRHADGSLVEPETGYCNKHKGAPYDECDECGLLYEEHPETVPSTDGLSDAHKSWGKVGIPPDTSEIEQRADREARHSHRGVVERLEAELATCHENLEKIYRMHYKCWGFSKEIRDLFTPEGKYKSGEVVEKTCEWVDGYASCDKAQPINEGVFSARVTYSYCPYCRKKVSIPQTEANNGKIVEVSE